MSATEILNTHPLHSWIWIQLVWWATSPLWLQTLFEPRGDGWQFCVILQKAKGRFRQNSRISSFPIPGFCDWKAQDKFYLSFAQAGSWPHVSLGHDRCPQGHPVPPFPCISAQGCTWSVWSNLWMWQHRAAARPSSTTKAQIWRNGRKQNHCHFLLPDLLPCHTRTGMPALAEWTFGEMQYYEPPPHWQSFATNPKTPLCWLELFSTLISPMMRQKLSGRREACGMDTKMLGNHQPGQGVTAENWEGLQSVSYQFWALWVWLQPWWRVLENIFNSWDSWLGKVMNSPLGAFSFRTCVHHKYLININISYVFLTIPFNIKMLWFSSLATFQAGQHFVMQGISKSPVKLFQSKQLIILKISRFIQISFFLRSKEFWKPKTKVPLCQHWLQTTKPEIFYDLGVNFSMDMSYLPLSFLQSLQKFLTRIKSRN